jgi:5'-methylthioadenosine phosphorylase
LPEIAVIARVGAHKPFLGRGIKEVRVEEVSTPFGKSNPFHIFEIEDLRFALLSRHGEEGFEVSAPYFNARANIWGLKERGVEKIISWSAPGSLVEEIGPGDIIVPDDLIDETKGRPRSFFEGKGLGVIRQNPVFCPGLREVFLDYFRGGSLKFHEKGTYVTTEGPRLETPAEIRKCRNFGGQLVGMNLSPELFLAKELEICYGAICYCANYAEGIKEAPFRAGILFEGLLEGDDKKKVERTESEFPRIILDLLEKVEVLTRDCPCKDLMKRYKLRGDIGEDWRKWI